jgi:ABC-2 type transport system ATP-binding protein
MAGLEEKANALVKELSGGQRQRLYFALAICGDPELIFFDEPTVGMDVESRRVFGDTIRDFARLGKTILLTTHYLEEADQLAQRIIVIDRGLVIADATPDHIKSQIVGKRVSFRIAAPLDQTILASLPHAKLEVDGDRVRLFSSSPETLLRELFASGVEISDLEVVGADLEEAFLNLTHAAEQEATA